MNLGGGDGGRSRWLLCAFLSVVLLASCSGAAEPPVAADAPGTPAQSTPAPATPEPTLATPDPTPEPTTNVAGVVVPPQAAIIASGYRIEIPRLGINLPIAEGDVPRDVDRAQTPEHYAFHLPGTAMFGAGNTYIYAHARVGMFLSLWNARVGDVVTVRTPNGADPRFVVVARPR